METLDAATIKRAAAHVADAQRVAVLSGAGISAESGLATFRDAQTGYWSQFDAEALATPQGFGRNPGLVWRWYMERVAGLRRAQPNPAHRALVALEATMVEFVLATQNIDNLHERAGSTHVLHLHGNLGAFRCSRCGRPYLLQDEDLALATPPACHTCGAPVRPGVVWFGEAMPERPLQRAWEAAQKCDLFLVVGTSGVVMPAAALPEVAREHGATVVEINADRSEITRHAHFSLRGMAGAILPAFVAALHQVKTGE